MDHLWCPMGVVPVFFLGLIIVHETFFGGKKKKKVLEESYEDNSVAHGGVEEEVGVGNADVIIVGAGVAGAALACALAKVGRRVDMIERDLTEPNRISSELLQPGGYLKLLDLDLAGENYPASDNDSAVGAWMCPSDFLMISIRSMMSQIACKRSMHREYLAMFCVRMGKAPDIFIRCRTSLLTSSDGDSITAGSFSRSLAHLADPSPILFYPISSNEVWCLVDIPRQKLPSVASVEMANYLKSVVLPQIPCEIYPSFVAAIEKGMIRSMPNQSMPAFPQQTPGVLLLGDAFNMRHPLTGGGMTVALSDVVILRILLCRVSDLNGMSALCKYLESFYTLRKPVASTINMFAGALYTVFCASRATAPTSSSTPPRATELFS